MQPTAASRLAARTKTAPAADGAGFVYTDAAATAAAGGSPGGAKKVQIALASHAVLTTKWPPYLSWTMMPHNTQIALLSHVLTPKWPSCLSWTTMSRFKSHIPLTFTVPFPHDPYFMRECMAPNPYSQLIHSPTPSSPHTIIRDRTPHSPHTYTGPGHGRRSTQPEVPCRAVQAPHTHGRHDQGTERCVPRTPSCPAPILHLRLGALASLLFPYLGAWISHLVDVHTYAIHLSLSTSHRLPPPPATSLHLSLPRFTPAHQSGTRSALRGRQTWPWRRSGAPQAPLTQVAV